MLCNRSFLAALFFAVFAGGMIFWPPEPTGQALGGVSSIQIFREVQKESDQAQARAQARAQALEIADLGDAGYFGPALQPSAIADASAGMTEEINAASSLALQLAAKGHYVLLALVLSLLATWLFRKPIEAKFPKVATPRGRALFLFVLAAVMGIGGGLVSGQPLNVTLVLSVLFSLAQHGLASGIEDMRPVPSKVS